MIRRTGFRLPSEGVFGASCASSEASSSYASSNSSSSDDDKEDTAAPENQVATRNINQGQVATKKRSKFARSITFRQTKDVVIQSKTSVGYSHAVGETADRDLEHGLKHKNKILRRFKKAVRLVIFARKATRNSAGDAAFKLRALKAKEQFSTNISAMKSGEEKKFATCIIGSVPLMMKQTAWMRDVNTALSKVLLGKDAGERSNRSSVVLDKVVNLVFGLKITTARVCWAGYVHEKNREIEVLQAGNQSQKDNFMKVRTEYLNEVVMLRDQVRARDDHDSKNVFERQKSDDDIKMFFDPMGCLTEEEAKFAMEVVKEKVKMIFAKNAALAGGTNTAQLDNMVHKMEKMEIAELKKALSNALTKNAWLQSERELLMMINDDTLLKGSKTEEELVRIIKGRCSFFNEKLDQQTEALAKKDEELDRTNAALARKSLELVEARKKTEEAETEAELAKARNGGQKDSELEYLKQTEAKLEKAEQLMACANEDMEELKKANADLAELVQTLRAKVQTGSEKLRKVVRTKIAEQADVQHALLGVRQYSDVRACNLMIGDAKTEEPAARSESIDEDLPNKDLPNEDLNIEDLESEDLPKQDIKEAEDEQLLRIQDYALIDAEKRIQELIKQRTALINQRHKLETAFADNRQLQESLDKERLSKGNSYMKDVIAENAQMAKMTEASNKFADALGLDLKNAPDADSTESSSRPGHWTKAVQSDVFPRKLQVRKMGDALNEMREKKVQLQENISSWIESMDCKDEHQVTQLEGLRSAARKQESDIFMAEVALDAIVTSEMCEEDVQDLCSRCGQLKDGAGDTSGAPGDEPTPEPTPGDDNLVKKEAPVKASTRALLQKVIMHTKHLQEKVETAALVNKNLTEAVTDMQSKSNDVVSSLNRSHMSDRVNAKIDALATATQQAYLPRKKGDSAPSQFKPIQIQSQCERNRASAIRAQRKREEAMEKEKLKWQAITGASSFTKQLSPNSSLPTPKRKSARTNSMLASTDDQEEQPIDKNESMGRKTTSQDAAGAVYDSEISAGGLRGRRKPAPMDRLDSQGWDRLDSQEDKPGLAADLRAAEAVDDKATQGKKPMNLDPLQRPAPSITSSPSITPAPVPYQRPKVPFGMTPRSEDRTSNGGSMLEPIASPEEKRQPSKEEPKPKRQWPQTPQMPQMPRKPQEKTQTPRMPHTPGGNRPKVAKLPLGGATPKLQNSKPMLCVGPGAVSL